MFFPSPLLALSMSCALCPTPFAQQHLKLSGPPNSGRSVAEWAPSLKRATDACVLASNNASPAQRGPRRDALPLHATPLAAVLFPAPLRARALFIYFNVETEGPTSESCFGLGCFVLGWFGRVGLSQVGCVVGGLGCSERQIFRCNLKSVATRSIPPKRKLVALSNSSIYCG